MSQTKPEILQRHLKPNDPNEDSFPAIMAAMEEYAQQEMAAFAEWLDNNSWFIFIKYQWMQADTEKTATTQELVQLFKNRNNA